MDACGVPYERLDARAGDAALPRVAHRRRRRRCVFQEQSGIAAAARANAAHQRLARAHGADLREDARVECHLDGRRRGVRAGRRADAPRAPAGRLRRALDERRARTARPAAQPVRDARAGAVPRAAGSGGLRARALPDLDLDAGALLLRLPGLRRAGRQGRTGRRRGGDDGRRPLVRAGRGQPRARRRVHAAHVPARCRPRAPASRPASTRCRPIATSCSTGCPATSSVLLSVGAGHAFKFATQIGRILTELALEGATRARHLALPGRSRRRSRDFGAAAHLERLTGAAAGQRPLHRRRGVARARRASARGAARATLEPRSRLRGTSLSPRRDASSRQRSGLAGRVAAARPRRRAGARARSRSRWMPKTSSREHARERVVADARELADRARRSSPARARRARPPGARRRAPPACADRSWRRARRSRGVRARAAVNGRAPAHGRRARAPQRPAPAPAGRRAPRLPGELARARAVIEDAAGVGVGAQQQKRVEATEALEMREVDGLDRVELRVVVGAHERALPRVGRHAGHARDQERPQLGARDRRAQLYRSRSSASPRPAPVRASRRAQPRQLDAAPRAAGAGRGGRWPRD